MRVPDIKCIFAGLIGYLALATIATNAHAAPARIAMSNGLTFPYTTLRSSASIRHYQKLRQVPFFGNAVYSNIELTYVNFVEITGGELTDYNPVTIQAEILYNGVYYPVTFDGQSSATINGGGSVKGQVAGLSLPTGAQFYERVRLVGALAGDQSYLMSHGAQRVLMEGPVGSTDASQNLLGGRDGHGAACAFTMTSGRVTSANLTAPGVNYTEPAIIVAYDRMTQKEDTVGYADETGGQLTDIKITNESAGFPDNAQCLVVGGGGFGLEGQVYAASMITGVPNVEGLESVLIVGDSIARGFGSTDSRGDDVGSYGIFERAVASRYATTSTAIPGNQASAYRLPSSHKRMYDIVLPYVTHAMINLGTNDLAMGITAEGLARSNTQIADELRRAGLKVSFITLIPRTSGSYETLAGQAPVTGFASGGAADTYNNWLRSGSNGLVSDWGIIDARAIFQDGNQQNKWRVDSVLTVDGIHPSRTVGVPFGAMNLAGRFGSLAPTNTDYNSVTTINSYANNTTINVTPTVSTVDVHGTNVTVNGGDGNYTLSAPAGGNTVNTGSGESTVNVDGIYTKINVGSGKTLINAQGTYNVIKLPPVGGGLTTISGLIFQHGSRLDLRPLLASTTWSGDSTTLDQYLKVWISENSAFLIVTPKGDGGQNFLAARLTSYDSLPLGTLLKYSDVK